MSYSTPLIEAIEKNDYKRIVTLIKSGHDVNKKNKNGCSPLICVSNSYYNYYGNGNDHNNSYSMIKILLEHGADVEQSLRVSY